MARDAERPVIALRVRPGRPGRRPTVEVRRRGFGIPSVEIRGPGAANDGARDSDDAADRHTHMEPRHHRHRGTDDTGSGDATAKNSRASGGAKSPRTGDRERAVSVGKLKGPHANEVGQSDPDFHQLEPDGELATPTPRAPTSRIIKRGRSLRITSS